MSRFLYLTVITAVALFAQSAEQPASLTELVKSNPAAALRQLSGEQSRLFQGELQTLAVDNPATGQTENMVTLRIGEERYPVYSEGLHQTGCSGAATVRGYRVGNQILAASIESGEPSNAQSCATLGDQRTVVLLVETPTLKLPPLITVPFVQGFMSTGAAPTVDGYFREVSAGRTTVTSDVFGPFTLGSEFGCIVDDTMIRAAIAAADASVNFQLYSRIIMITPTPLGGCFTRVSTLSCEQLSSTGDGSFAASWAFISSDILTSANAGVNLAAKSLASGMGIRGSSTRDYGTLPLGPFDSAGTDSANGNHSITGGFTSYSGVYPLGHIPARQKLLMGWLDSGTGFLNVQTNSVHTILPVSSPTAGVKALRIRRGSGYNQWLWVEHRQFIGPYDSTLQSYAPTLSSGVLIHHERPADNPADSFLLHFKPVSAPNDFRTAVLTPGAQWDDPSTNLTLQVTAVPTGMQVTTTYRPSGGCVYLLNPATYTASAVAGASGFSITTGPYCEWTAIPSSGLTTITSGTTGTGNGNVTYSYAANPGAARSSVIDIWSQAFTFNQAQAGTLQISGKVSSSGAGVSGVTVTLTGTVGQSATTDANGNYVLSLLPAGTYTVTPTKAGLSFTPASTQVTLSSTNQVANFSSTGSTITSSLDRTRLNFAARTTALLTPAQNVVLSFTGGAGGSWTASTNQPWLQVSPASGNGATRLTVSLVPAALPASGTVTATVTVNTPNASPAALTLPVYLTRLASSTAPFGAFDTPVNNATQIAGSIAVTGWALDDIFVSKVSLYREKIGGEIPGANGYVFIADMLFVPNARPDVEGGNPSLPFQYRAGWGYLMLTTGIPNASGPMGNGTIKLWAFATDVEGNTTNLGSKTITLNNAASTKPFGAIDTPTQGGSTSGANYINFGWALTPLPNIISRQPTDIWVGINGQLVSRVNYGQFRSDIAAGFPGYRNSGSAQTGGAGGHYIFDTAQYANGMHTIGWLVTDDVGNAEGIGSRFFFVENGVSSGAAAATAPVIPADSPDRAALRAARPRPQRGAVPRVMTAQELERLVITLPEGHWTGAHVINGDPQPLPVGSTLDNSTGTFYWQLGPGFLGRHELLFNSTDGAVHGITVSIEPKSFSER